jgi:hypothetical protein
MPEFIVRTDALRGAPGLAARRVGHAGTAAVWADALFVSVLQRSDKPDAGQVRQAIAAAVRVYGDQGCAQRVAQEFGDHPETAVARMHWARAVASTMPGSPPGPGTAAPQPAGTASGPDSCRSNTRNNLYQSEHDLLIALYTKGDGPE